MILRRLSQSMKEQNWIAIWIEFVLLVLGVFLGIQVANWNQARLETLMGEDYVTRLIRDLEADEAMLGAVIEYYDAVLQAVMTTDELLGQTDPDPVALIINAYRATDLAYVPPVRATWDQVVSSGHLGLLPRAAEESKLSQYYAYDYGRDIYDKGFNSPYRETVRNIIPIAMQNTIRTQCGDVRGKYGYIVGFVEDCRFDANPVAISEVAALLHGNPVVAAQLRYQFSFASNAGLNLKGARDTISEGIKALGKGSVSDEKKDRHD